MSKINKHIQLNFGYGNGRFKYTYNSQILMKKILSIIF